MSRKRKIANEIARNLRQRVYFENQLQDQFDPFSQLTPQENMAPNNPMDVPAPDYSLAGNSFDGKQPWMPGEPFAAGGYSMMRAPKFPGRYFGYRAVPRSNETFRMYGPSWKYASPAQRQNRWEQSYIGQGRYKRRYRGRGLYTGAGSYFSRMMGRQFNRTMAGKTPLGRAAAQVGRAALQRGTNMAMSAIGNGSYKVAGTKGNHLIDGMGSGTPSFRSAGDETGALTVQHTEYIKDIYGIEFSGSPLVPTTNMQSDIVVLNPGKAESFPWLSQIAANYEEYEIKQLMFCYKSKVSDNLTSSDGQVGSIIMFTEYNANDAMKKTKQQLLQAYGTTNALINTSDVLHGIECDVTKLKGDGHKYIRTENLPATTDKSDYDWAKLQVAVVDTPSQLSNQVVGELYVSYTVVLRKPRLFSTLALNLQEDQFMMKTDQVGGALAAANIHASGAETNSIGCRLQDSGITDSSGSDAGVIWKLTFPASFSGDVEILASVDAVSGNGAIYGTGYTQTDNLTTGNVVNIKNIPVSYIATDPNSLQSSNDNSGDGTFIGHYRISQASMGVDNCLAIWVVHGRTASQAWIKVSRYNGHESDVAPVFKQLDGTGKVDPQDITMAIAN